MKKVPVGYLQECFELVGCRVIWKDRPLSHFKNLHGKRIYDSKTKGSEFGAPSEDGPNVYRLGSITYQGRQYNLKYHTVVWVLYFGVYPADRLDHLDGNGLNNAITNLREANAEVNAKNMTRTKLGESGVCGVYPTPSGKWSARASKTTQGKRVIIHLGVFANLSSAIAARLEWEKQNGYTNTHGRKK